MSALDEVPEQFLELVGEVEQQWASLRDMVDELTAIAVGYKQSGCKNKALGQRFRTTTCTIEKHMKLMRETTKAVTKLTPGKKRKARPADGDDEAA